MTQPPAETAYQNLKTLLEKERKLRRYVFASDEQRLAIKITECDNALADLEILHGAAKPATQLIQEDTKT